VQALNLSLLPEAPSDAVTAVKCPPGLAGNKVVDHAQAAYGYRFVNGQDRLKGLIFRIGHMGVLTEADMMGVLHVVECTMADLGQWRGRRGAALAAAEEALDTSTVSPGARRQAT
jgi:alanine-glyoxylate transaminase/serine-glyoxylate transaminase/serine-pyruvate transaminase